MRAVLSLFAVTFVAARAAETYPAIMESLSQGRQILRPGESLCQENECCYMSSTEDCSLAKMERGKSYLVYPDAVQSQAQCIFGDAYAFQVIPGETDKLLIYLQGGGACWSASTTNVLTMCTTTSTPNGVAGVFDPSNQQNPYASYTIVHPLYCSGDLWAGNITQSYKHHTGKPVVQVGIYNMLSTVSWIQAQQQAPSASLQPHLAKLVVMGCSAGSIGAQLWGSKLVQTFPADQLAIVPDSYVGVFPPGSMGPLFYAFGICTETVGLVPPSLSSACLSKTLTLQAVVAANMQSIPHIATAFIQSKLDIVQQQFYVAVAATEPVRPLVLTPTAFYDAVNDIFSVYNAENPNFLSFLVSGGQHCFTPINLMYDTTGNGPRTNDDAVTSLTSWLAGFPQAPGAQQQSICEGELEDPQALGKHHAVSRNTYCSTSVVPKSYTQE